MSKGLNLHSADTTVTSVPGVGITHAAGATVPSDAALGYAPGCIFQQTDGTGESNYLYVNVGTLASANFDAVDLNIAEAALLSGITATAAEINQACDESLNSEVVTTTNVITAAESGETFFLNAAGGFTSTLPAPALGLRYRFIVKTSPTTSYVIVTTSSANIMYGMMEERAGTAGVAGSTEDTFNFVGGQSIVGDWVEFQSDGTNWYYHGMVDIAAGNTVTFS